MRILMTGVGGFVGSRLARYLVERGFQVHGTYIGEPPELSGVSLAEADVLDPESLTHAVAGARPEIIVHLAALSHVGASWQQMPEYFQVNVLGTDNLLRAADGIRLLLVSSAEVYGLVPELEQPITEERPLAPRTPYALTKASAERLAAASGAIVVRCFNVVGPGQSPTFALPAFATQLVAISRGEQEPILRVGNLTARRDFVHVDDTAEGFRVLLEHGEPGRAYNLASGKAYSIADALQSLLIISGLEVRVEEDPQRIRPVDVPLLVGNSSRLHQLGWAPNKDLSAALSDLWRWAQQEV